VVFSAQVALGRWLTDASGGVLRFLRPVPEPVLGVGLLLFAVAVGWLGVRGARRRDPSHEEGGFDDFQHENACHAHDTDAKAR
jgi:hypothetical protein